MNRVRSYFVLCFLCTAPQIVRSSKVLETFVKIFNMCHRNNSNLLDCVKERSFIALDNVYRSENDISVIPNFISIVRFDRSHIQDRSGKKMLADLDNENPANKSSIINNLIIRRMYDFVETRAVNIKIPIASLDILNVFEDTSEVEGRSVRSDRGKKDKGGSLIAMGAMFVGTMMTMKIAAIAAIAGKALMASLIATLLAALAVLSKKSGGTHGSTYEVINVPTHGHHGRRLIPEAEYTNQYQHVEPSHNEQLDVSVN